MCRFYGIEMMGGMGWDHFCSRECAERIHPREQWEHRHFTREEFHEQTGIEVSAMKCCYLCNKPLPGSVMTDALKALVAEIKTWARKNYSRGGDVIVECFEDEEIASEFTSLDDAREFCDLKREQEDEVKATAW